MKKQTFKGQPNVNELQTELKRVNHKSKYYSVMRSTVFTLITVAAVAILVATLWLPVLQIYGSSMTPTLYDGQIVFSVKTSEFERGDIIAFYYNNKILVKRVIGLPGDQISIDSRGNVKVNGIMLDESYISEKALGECDIDQWPYSVPDEQYFVMGDHRETSVDSRTTTVGCVVQEEIVGKIVFRVWPIPAFGKIE